MVKNEMAKEKEIVADNETVDDVCLTIPAAKRVKIKVDCTTTPVEVVEDNITSQPWAVFQTTRIKLYAEEKAILVGGGKLNKHINLSLTQL